MQDRPVCFECDKAVETNSEMVFESPCGHDECSSAVFHSICLFSWRERRQRMEKWFNEVRERWIREHEGNREEKD